MSREVADEVVLPSGQLDLIVPCLVHSGTFRSQTAVVSRLWNCNHVVDCWVVTEHWSSKEEEPLSFDIHDKTRTIFFICKQASNMIFFLLLSRRGFSKNQSGPLACHEPINPEKGRFSHEACVGCQTGS